MTFVYIGCRLQDIMVPFQKIKDAVIVVIIIIIIIIIEK